MKKIIICFSLMCSEMYAYTVYQTTGVTSDWNLTTTWNTGTVPSTAMGGATEIIVMAGHTLNLMSGSAQGTWVGRCAVQVGGTLNLNGFDLRIYSVDGVGFPPCNLTVDGRIIGFGTVYMDYANNFGTFSGTGLLDNSGGIFLHSFSYTYDIPLGSNLTVTNGVGLNNRDTWMGSSWGATTGNVSIAGTLNITNGSVNMGHLTNTSGKSKLTVTSTGSLNINNGDMIIVRQSGTGLPSSTLNSPTILNSGYIGIGGSLLLGSIYPPSANHNYITFNNNAGSTLLVKGSIFPRDAFYPTKYLGRLNAFAANNTVIYGGITDMDITITGTAANTTTENTYFNLTLQGNGIKNILKDNITNRDLRVSGNLTIAGAAQLDVQNAFFPSASDIYLSGNWINTSTLANPFVERTNTVLFTGTGAQSLMANVGGGETFYNLTINNTSTGLTQVNNNITVTNTLSLTNGLVHTGIYELNVTNNLLTSVINYSGTSYVDGYLKRSLLPAGGIYNFPVGNITAYELAIVNFTAAHTVNNLLVNFSNLPPGTGLPLTEGANTFATVLNCGGASTGVGNANDGVWTITPDAGTANYDLTLHGKNYSNAGIYNTILKRVGNTSPWTLQGNYSVATGTEPIITTRIGYSGFSQFAIGGTSAILPIELLSFEGTYIPLTNSEEQGVGLRWITASETNNDYFTVERSADAVNYEIAGIVKGAGNSITTKKYEFIDKLETKKLETVFYYRLKQTDYNGTYKYSNIIDISIPNTQYSNLLLIYPNPVENELVFQFVSQNKEAVLIEVAEYTGRVIVSQSYSPIESQNIKKIDFTEASSGLYMLTIKTKINALHQKFIKK